MIEQKGKPSGLIHAVKTMQFTDTAVGKATSEDIWFNAASVMPIKKWLHMSTKLKLGANPITENVDFKKEFPFSYSLGVSFMNDFDLHQINLGMGEAEAWLHSVNLAMVKSCNNKNRAMVIVPNATTEASFMETLQKYNWIDEIQRAMGPKNEDNHDAAVQCLILYLAKHYPNAFSSATKELGLEVAHKFTAEEFLAISVAINLTKNAQCTI